jgi:polysaccharide pyruvyl transferase WcaK-like protein
MKTTYHGYYGVNNSGDDAFVEVASWGAQKYWGCTNHLFFASELPKTITKTHCFSPHKSYANFIKAIYSIFSSDIFVSAGGSTFHSSLKKTDLRTYAKLKKNLLPSSVAGAIGISLGPFTSVQSEKNTVEYLKKLNFLALRDKYSYDLACSYNLPYKPVEAFDLAGLLPAIYNGLSASSPLKAKSEEKVIGVSICNYERYSKGDLTKEKHRNNYFMEVLAPFVKEPMIKFRFFIFNGNDKYGDKEVTAELVDKLKDIGMTNFEIVPYLNNVKLTWDKIKECDIVISTRLHASVFACFADVPFFLLEYHRKCTDFLDDVAHSKDYRLFDATRDLKEVEEQMRKILFNDQYIYPSNKLMSEQKALRNFTETYWS